MKKSMAAVAVLSMFVAGSSMAQEGKWEASIAGNMTATSTDVGGNSSDSTSTFLYMRLGQYISPELVVSGNVSMFGSSSGGGTNSNVGTTFGLGAKYYMDGAAKSAFVPFVEGEVHAVVISSTVSNFTSTTTGGGFAAGVGGSYFITEDVSADVSFQGFADSLTPDSGPSFSQSGVRMLFGLTARY
jgi:hypothetical protein